MDNAEEITTQHIEYTRTVVPSTMRSPYWKFFGFPSDSSNNVLTKQKIICTLCNAVIAYNKNTSNLRTHIVARHPELLIELYNEKNKKNTEVPVPTSLLHNKVQYCEPAPKRQKTVFLVSSNETKENVASHSSFVSASNEPNALKPYVESLIELNEVIELNDDNEKTADNSDYDDFGSSINQNAEYSIEEVEENSIKITASSAESLNIDELVIEMLVTDLHPPSFVEDVGFIRFTGALNISTNLPSKNHIEQKINKKYNRCFKRIHQHLKNLTNTSPYSLSIEFYQNIENKAMISINFNHIIPSEARLEYTAYSTIEATSDIDYGKIFSDFNLSNCSAVIINEENETIDHFFASNGIPVIPCFEAVINSCMSSIFNHSTVNRSYKKTLELFEKHDCASMLDSFPEVHEENPWSKFNFLQFVQDHLSMVDEENSEAIEISKQLVAFLNPFKTTLETIADEPLPLCSLMKPLSRKLTDEYFSSFFCESEAMSDVKNTVTLEFSQRVLENMFLSEASFLDPRLKSCITESESIHDIKESIAHRFEHLLTNHAQEQKTIKQEAKTPQRKSSLKLFLNRGSQQEVKPQIANTKRSLDYEIMKYSAENGADLEQCPLKWWEENEFIFKKLRKISDYYICVPCCSTNRFKNNLNDKINFINRRFLLRKNIANQILFLNLNREILERLTVNDNKKENPNI